MADQRYTDNFNPELDSMYVSIMSTLKSRLWTSGVVAANDDLHSKINGEQGGNSFNTPFRNTIANVVPVTTNDDPSSVLTLNNFSTGTYSARAYQRATGFSSMDLANLVSGVNGPQHVRDGIAEMWVNDNQRTLLAQMEGLFLDDAGDANDMSQTTYVDTASPSAAQKISGVGINAAKHTMGDSRSSLRAIMMHSDSRQVLEDAEPNAFVPASTSNIGFDTYHGLVIIEDDSCTVGTGAINGEQYTSYLVGAGAFQFASDTGLISEEWEREAGTGNGGGQTKLYTRRRQILQPQGFSCLTAGVEETHNTTNAEFALAATWDRVVGRKLVNLAALNHNV